MEREVPYWKIYGSLMPNVALISCLPKYHEPSLIYCFNLHS